MPFFPFKPQVFAAIWSANLRFFAPNKRHEERSCAIAQILLFLQDFRASPPKRAETASQKRTIQLIIRNITI